MPLTRRELIEALQSKGNPDDVVVIYDYGNQTGKAVASSESGYRYLPEQATDDDGVLKDLTWGELGLEKLKPQDREQGFTEDDIMTHERSVGAVVIFPA